MGEAAALEEVPLSELQPDSCAIGEWTLRVHGQPNVVKYEYQQGGNNRMGARLECTLLSTDPGSYCRGVARGSGPTGEMQLKKVVNSVLTANLFHSLTGLLTAV